MGKRIVIVGGVAAGASAAAKARRMNEDVEIVLIEAGPYISFANCGLPYYVGGEIANRDGLFVVGEDRFARRYNVALRLNTRASAVNRERRTVTVRPLDGGTEKIHYDRLVLATGAVCIKPPIKGLARENVFTLRTVPEADAITEFLAKASAPERAKAAAGPAAEAPLRALVIGGGYIGLEMAEQLLRRGLKVSVVEVAEQLMLSLDAEMAEPLREALAKAGCEVIIGDGVAEIAERKGQTLAVTNSGREIPLDLAILAVGVRPNVELAEAAGIALGKTGAIRVNSFQRTSDPAIYAAGDNCEAYHLVLERPVNIPLAGPANKAGRTAGANAALDLAGADDDDPRRLRFRGVLGTAIVRACDAVAGVTGITQTQAAREGIAAEATYMFGASHASYYPGAKTMLIKLLYASEDGRLLGAQAVGGEGVDKRLDVLAPAIAPRMTVEDLEQLDLCYAPPFGSAKDVAILAGFAAANARRGLMPAVTPAELLDELASADPPLLIDDRSQREYAAGHVEGAINIPIDELRGRLDEVPSNRPVVIHCATGYRSYLGQRMLMNRGRTDVRNLLGGYVLLRQVQAARAARRTSV